MNKLFEQLSRERKDLQTKGYYPSWFTTQGHQMFKDKYMYEDTYLLGRHKTIAKTLASYLPTSIQEHYEQVFFDLLWSGKLSAATPVLANCGTNRGLTVSCSGQYIGDSIDSFYSNLRETALLSKYGFGTSGGFSSIRERGAVISKGGTANGVRPVIDDFFIATNKVSQGGNRRGSFAAYLDIEHDDFDECLQDLFINTDGKNYGWVIKDSFINKLQAGDEEANRRFKEIIYLKLIHGKGYFFFVDRANRHRPEMYKEHGLDIKASNLCCVTADQRVVTDKGIITVEELYKKGGDNKVIGHKGISNASAMMLPRPNAPIIEIQTKQGYSHKVTPDHRVMTLGGQWVEAQNLKIGDRIELQNQVGLFGTQHNPDLAFLMGIIAGDGTYSEHSVCIDLWENKTKVLEKEIESKVFNLLQSNKQLNTTSSNSPKFVTNSLSTKSRLSSAPLNRLLSEHGFTRETKLVIPDLVWKGTRETVEAYIKGLFITDGGIQADKNVCTVTLASINHQLLKDLQVLLINLNIKSSISILHPERIQDFGKNRGGEYHCKASYRLMVTSIQACNLLEKITSISKYREGKTSDSFLERISKKGFKQKFHATITDLKELPNEDTYCLTVDSEDHSWTVNGVITHNSEIMLHSGPDYTYSCILSSINLTHWDEIENDNTIFDATVFLDCVTSDFIHNASTIPGLERVVEFTKKGRAIGLGVMGLHTLLQSKSIPMDSMEAHLLDGTIFKRLHDESLRASQWLAAIQGEPDWCKGYGVRNTHRCVTGDTEVITKQGSKPIKSLVGQTLEIWNGYEWSVMTPFITSESEEVYKVTLSNGKEVICTPDHKWAVKNNRHRKPISVETIDLKEGDKLNKWDYPTLEGDKELSHPYTSGFFSGDGSYSQSKPQYPNCKQRKEIRICPKSGKEVCLDYLSVKDGCTVRDSNGGYRFYIPDEVSEKFFVPNEDYTVNSRLKWLAGLLDADGSNAGAFTTINLEFAKKVVHLANVTGLYASLTTEKPARISEIEGRTINCKPLYKVGFSRKQLVESYDKGLTIRRLDFGKPNRESIDYVSVISVEKKGNSKTYCVTDKLRGTCMFNGITTLQCAQAPTKSTALLMGGVSEGISPDPGMAFEASSAVGELTRITPVFYQLMKERGMYSEKTVNRIIENLGSVQQEDWLTDHEKDVFKTAFEVSQEMLINRTAARQKYFCQGQSLNLFVPGDGDGVEERIAQLISQVFVNENILSQYYIYSRNGVVVNDDCVACSA